jgi:hypothetical protein
MDIKDLRILLSSIIELRELWHELMDPRRGANTGTADIIHDLGLDRLERVESGEYFSEWDHRRTSENPG